MARAVPEWIGASDDAAVPLRVRLRVFERCGGKCHLSGRKILAGDEWDLDHIVALVNGGEHRELNLAPALKDKHREKTAEDVKVKAKIARVRAKFLGQWPKSPGFRPDPRPKGERFGRKFTRTTTGAE